jgi:beta-phosphoglucomutase-like phosphatase (HAD superfamily)
MAPGSRAVIFDVDGVLVDSPHFEAWRDALGELMDGEWAGIRSQTTYSPERFTQEVYQDHLAGRPRLDGARAALTYFRVPDADRRAERYAALKQDHMARLIKSGQFVAYPDALRLVLDVTAAGIPLAAASSSKNADLIMGQIQMDTVAAGRLHEPASRPGGTLLALLNADVSGRDLPRGKPDPLIFLTAASELGVPPGGCFVVEDAPSGVQAAKAGGMAAIGVARVHDQDVLRGAGADLVVRSLDEVSRDALAAGQLKRAG